MHQKPWLNNYPQGVPAEIEDWQFDSINDLFLKSCAKYADKPALMNFGTRLNYRELEQKAKQFASFLQLELGIRKGDRVAVMLPNLMQYHVVMFGILLTGAVVVNVNPLYTAREVEHQLKDAAVEHIVVLANFAKTLEQVSDKLSLKNIILTEVGDMLGGIKGKIVNFVVKYIKRMVPSFNLANTINFAQALQKGEQANYQPVEMGLEDTAFLQYTGGTTGLAKGAELSHRNLVANVIQGLTWMHKRLSHDSPIVVAPLPLYHIFSLTISGLCIVKLGGMSILITNPRDLSHFIKEIQNIPFTVIVGINTLFNALIHQGAFRKLNFSYLSLTISGGMSTQKKVAEEWQRLTDCPILEGYGLTETSPMVTINSPENTGFTGSIGMPIPSTDVMILAENGEEQTLGEPGEICVKGPQVMKGYWQKPEATKESFTQDGWFRTGDIGKMDENGRFYIVDRKKDMIVVSGFNVYPNEVEDILVSHPAVLEAAVIGVESEKTGEAVKAFVVLKKDHQVSEEELIEHSRQALTAYKVPKLIAFRDELPKSNVGKILRRKLKEEQDTGVGA